MNYPKTIEQDWEIENVLKKELEAVRRCMLTCILFLNDTEETLRKHKESDDTRRTFLSIIYNIFTSEEKMVLCKKECRYIRG